VIRRGHAAVRRTPNDAPIVFYHQLLLTLERQGVPKPPTVTPAEFAERHPAHAESSDAIRRVTKCYYDVRYGRRRLSEDERRQIESDLAIIERGR
jgi:hypothetical protein